MLNLQDVQTYTQFQIYIRTQGAEGGGNQARSGLADLFSRQKVSQKFGGEYQRPVMHGGDEDVPRRAPLHERRAQFDAKVARKNAHSAAEALGGLGVLALCLCVCVCVCVCLRGTFACVCLQVLRTCTR